MPNDVLRAIDTRTLTIIGGQAPLGLGPHFNVAISLDGRRVYVTLLLTPTVATFLADSPGTVSQVSPDA